MGYACDNYRKTKGSIGYLDAGHGRNQAGLGEVSLKNGADKYVISSDLEKTNGLGEVADYAVAKNVFKADYTGDWSDVALLNLGSVVGDNHVSLLCGRTGTKTTHKHDSHRG